MSEPDLPAAPTASAAEEAPSPVEGNVGRQVGGYTIESVLGRGGMGVVYVARQRFPDRKVALKLINPAFADDGSFRVRFLREAGAAAAIDHPHVLPVYEASEAGDALFIAMRLVHGEDLRAILRRGEHLEIERVVSIVAQVGSALDAAHARGLIHRDVKPGNILVAHQGDGDEEDFCYLMDFGVSTWVTSSAATITSPGSMVGSLNYAAPEQIEGTSVGPPADIYSLGCVLFECLTGRAPFGGRTAPATLYAHLHEEPPSAASLRPDLPPTIDAVLREALAKDPGERFASAREMTAALRGALSTGSAPPAVLPARPDAETAAGAPVPADRLPAPGEPRRRHGWWVAATVVTVTIAIAATVAALISRQTPEPTPGRTTSGPTTAAPQLIRQGVQVTASSTAPASVDAAGNVVTYVPSHVIDGNVETAWRAPGDGRGVTLTLLFDTPVDVVRIGLIPGYAKSDPETGENRFQENRIIERVRYLAPGLPPVTQTFRPMPVPQFVRLPVTTSRITIEILDTTEPGGKDFTAISEVYVYGYRQ